MRGCENERYLKAQPPCQGSWRGFTEKGFERDIFLRLFVCGTERLNEILAGVTFQVAVVFWEIWGAVCDC